MTALPLPDVPDALWDDLPDYAPLLSARHAVHRALLADLIASLPLPDDAEVFDVACGDGFFTALLAAQVPGGQVTGLDADPAFLALARQGHVGDAARLVEGDAASLPLEDGRLHAVFCAHSLRSLPDPSAALAEWRRVLRPDGRVILIENDRLHQCMLPWPPEVELALFRAEADSPDGALPQGRMQAGRCLGPLLEEAGLTMTARRSVTTSFATPPTDAERAYLAALLKDRIARVRGDIPASQWPAVAEWACPDGAHYLPDDAHLEATFLDVLVIAQPA